MSEPVNQQHYFVALTELGYESFSVEPDGTCWTGTSDNPVYLDLGPIRAKVREVEKRPAGSPPQV